MERTVVRVVCLDLEGVLIPEMWIMVAEETGIADLRLTTRDIDDYDELMTHRLRVLTRHGVRLQDIQKIIATLEPIPGGKAFLDALREKYQAVILSDTFIQFAAPAMRTLNQPFLLCNELVTDPHGMIIDYRLRQKEGKQQAVKAFKGLNLEVLAVGDSFNDITMLREADSGYLFRPSETVSNAHPDLPRFDDHDGLLKAITETRRVVT